MILKSVQDMPAVKSGTIKLPAMASPTEATTGTDWPQPQPLPGELPSVSPFDFAMLPDTLRPWITDIADRMQCSPEYAAVGAIVALGSLIGRKVGIRPKRHDDWLIIRICGVTSWAGLA